MAVWRRAYYTHLGVRDVQKAWGMISRGTTKLGLTIASMVQVEHLRTAAVVHYESMAQWAHLHLML